MQVTHNNQTWRDVCFRVPVVSPPRCLDTRPGHLLALLGRRRRRREVGEGEGDFFADTEEDEAWFNDDNDDGGTSDGGGDDGCANFTLPQLSPAQLASLLPLAHQYKTEGFSLDLGGCGGDT